MKLVQVDLNNADEVDEAIGRTISHYMSDSWADDFDEAQIIIGQSELNTDIEPGQSLIVIGSSGEIRGPVKNAVMIGSRINFVGDARVQHSALSIGSDVRMNSSTLLQAQSLSVTFPYDSRSWMESLAATGRQTLNEQVPWRVWPGYLSGSIASLLVAVGLGALSLAFFPQFHRQSGAWLMERKGAALGLGVLGYLGFFLLSLLLIVSIFGILLLPSWLLLFVVLSAIGYFTAALVLGHALVPRQPWKEFWKFCLGLLILQIVGLIPGLGWLVVQLVAMAGFGAVLHTMDQRLRKKRRSSPRPPEPRPRPTVTTRRWRMPSSAR
jgi:hypothetical protein